MIAKVKQAMADATCVSWNTDVEKQEQTFSNQVDSILRHLTVHDGRGPKKSYIDDNIWQQRDLMIRQRKRLKVLRCRLRSEVLSMAFYAWRGQPDHHCAIEAFNYGTTLRCYGIKIFSAFNASRQLRNMIKDAKNLLIDQRLQETSEHTASSHILYN